MAITVKVARTARELDDIYRLRYRVYVEERGKFGTTISNNPRIMDHFDAIPGVVNIIAYSGGETLGAIRVNMDSDIGLPAEQYFSFSEVRKLVLDNARKCNENAIFASCSMLAVDEKWRNRRSVIFSLFKAATGILYSWKVTHVICAISEETFSMYGRLGFDCVAQSQWMEHVGDHILPISAPFNKIFEWSFDELSKTIDRFWLDNFCGQFERVLLSPGEVLFNQNDLANHTYAVDEGWIAISREDPEGNEMVLANLSRGALFGEVAVFDGETRSAKAIALANTELIAIERSHLYKILKQKPENMEQLLRHFATLVRDSGNMAMVQAFAHQTARVDFALKELWRSAIADKTHEGLRSIKVGPAQIAKTARVREEDVRQVLELKKSQGILDYGNKIIKFFMNPNTDLLESNFRNSPI